MNFHSWLLALGGGLLIGSAATLFLLLNGRIAGISNIAGGLWTPKRDGISWRLFFVLGLIAGGLTLSIFYPQAFHDSHPRSLEVLALAGFLVGFGSSLANGCTSGHGVCGLSRRSLRSLVATVVFILAAMTTVYLTDHVWARG
jgi:uncharacterized membrane protein YedE/YeeE